MPKRQCRAVQKGRIPAGRLRTQMPVPPVVWLHAGWQTLWFKPDSLDLPPGIKVDRVTPQTLRVEGARLGVQTP